eukprot:UN03562
MISIFHTTNNSLTQLIDVIPQIRVHIMINRYFCPMIFSSTVACMLISGVWFMQCNREFGPGACSSKLFNTMYLLNFTCDSVVMFYTVYGPFHSTTRAQTFETQCENTNSQSYVSERR